MSRLVVDASTVVRTLIPDEHDETTERVRVILEAADFVQPSHWPIEVVGSILRATRRKRISADQRGALRDVAIAYIDSAELEGATNARSAFDLAVRNHISVYDAAYLQLALRTSLPLLTSDKALRGAAIAAGAELIELR